MSHNGIKMRARIYYPAYPLIILCILLALCFSAEGAVKKQTLAINGYENQMPNASHTGVKYRAVPVPDANGQIEFYETFEPNSASNSGLDYSSTYWTLANSPDPNETTQTHSGFGDEILELASSTSAPNALVDFGSSYTEAGVTVAFRLGSNPGTQRYMVQFRESGGTIFGRLVATTTAGRVTVGLSVDGSAWTSSSNINSLDTGTWYKLQMYYLAGSNTTEIWVKNEDGTDYTGDSDGVCEATESCVTGVVPYGSNLRSVRLGGTVNDTWTQYYDDLILRNCASPNNLSKTDCWVGAIETSDGSYCDSGETCHTWNAWEFLTDGLSTTGWEYLGISIQNDFELADPTGQDETCDSGTCAAGTCVGGDCPKAIRAWETVKQKSPTLWEGRIGYSFDDAVGTPDSDMKRGDVFDAKSTVQNVFAQREKNIYPESNFTNFDWATATCDTSTCGVDHVMWSMYEFSSDPHTKMGSIITEGWMDVIYGKIGDAFLTDGPVFSAGTDEGSTSTVKVHLRANEATDLMVRYDTNATKVINGQSGGSQASVTTPVSVTSSNNYYTLNSGIELTGLTPATVYYIDVLVKQSTGTTPDTPDELRFTFSGSGLVVGDTVTWPTHGGAGEGTVVYISGSTMMVRVTTWAALADTNEVHDADTHNVTVSGTPEHWISTYAFESSFAENKWDTGTVCTAENVPWDCCTGAGTGTCPPQFKSHLADGYSSEFKVSPSGDPHDTSLNNQIWDTIGKESNASTGTYLQQWIMMGDEDSLQDADFIYDDTLYYEKRSRRGWGAGNLYYWQNVLSKTEHARIISDHEIAENNSHAYGWGDWNEWGVGAEGGNWQWMPTWKPIQFIRDTTPYYALGSADDYVGTATVGASPLCTLSTTRLCDADSPERQFTFSGITLNGSNPNPYCLGDNGACTALDTPYDCCTNAGQGTCEGECDSSAETVSWNGGANTGTLLYYDPTDKIMIVTATGDASLATDDVVTNGTWTTTGALSNIYNFPTVSRYGVYQGMPVEDISDSVQTTNTYAMGIVKKNYGTYVDLVSALANSGSFTANDSYRFKRSGLFYTFTQGNVKFLGLDIRSRRNPNMTPNGDKFDATAIGMPYTNCWGTTTTACISKDVGDGGGDDTLAATTGTTPTTIKHLDANIETDLANKWDMACAWDSDSNPFRGCALTTDDIQNAPPPAIFAQDDFDGSTEMVLSSHPADVGGWIEHPSFTVDMYVEGTPSNYARGNSGTVTSLYYNNGSPVNAEYDVQADLRETYNGLYYTGICGRVNCIPALTCATTNERYCVNFRGTAVSPYAANTWVLQEIIGGVTTDLGSYTGDDIYGTTRTVKLEIRDATKKVIIGGTERISHSATNDITAAGYSAIMGRTISTSLRGSYIDNFSATNSAVGTAGTVGLEWEIPGLQGEDPNPDRIRFFETGASTYGTDKLDINNGHPQRTFTKQELTNSDIWGVILSETPFASFEVANFDKWADVDGMSKLAEVKDDTAWGSETVYDYYPGTGSLSEKPGAVYGVDVNSMKAPVYEVANKTDLDATSAGAEWWWDSINGRVYIYGGAAIAQDWQFYRTNYHDRVAMRLYMLTNFGYKNKVVLGADRHWPYLHTDISTIEPWPYIGAGPLHVASSASQGSSNRATTQQPNLRQR